MAGRAAHEEDDDGVVMKGPAHYNRIQLINTPTGAISVARKVAMRLLEEGIITGDLDGQLRAQDALTVKAAVIGHAGVCDFCSAPAPQHTFDVADFDMPGMPGLESTGGWAACDDCAKLVANDRRKDLLDRTLNTTTFGKFSRDAVAELHGRFWASYDAMAEVAVTHKAIMDTVNGELPADVDPEQVAKNSPRWIRMRVIQGELGFTEEEVEMLLRGKLSTAMARRMLEWKRRGQSKLLPEFVKPRPPVPASELPHWQRALDAKVQAYRSIKKMITQVNAMEFYREGMDVNDPAVLRELVRKGEERRAMRAMGFGEDLKGLQAAQVYSFNIETMLAIREAAKTIPRDTLLSEIELPPTGAGWFYFAEPLPVRASNLVSDQVNALLWTWERGRALGTQLSINEAMFDRLAPADQERLGKLAQQANSRGDEYMLSDDDMQWLGPALRAAGFTKEELDARTTRYSDENPALVFSAYVIDEKGQYTEKGTIAPSTRFFWRFQDSLDEMVEKNGQAWEKQYSGSDAAYVMPKDVTLRAVGELALFFAMACTWFKQTVAAGGKKLKPPVLETTPGQIEGKKKRDAQNEMKIATLPPVHVVALRKSARTERSEPVEHAPGSREYHCWWVVKGHPRRQACGPGRKDRKLIWIEAHPAGPQDKPFRSSETVYAVIR